VGWESFSPCSQGLLAEYARAVLAEKVLRFHRIQAIGIFFPLCRVRGRINELARRVTNKTMERVSERVAITKEWILRELLDNAEQAKADGSWAARNRSLELVGKEIGMFGDQEPAKPPRLEDLPTEDLERMLAESIAATPPSNVTQ